MSYTNKENSVGGVKDEEKMTIVQHYDIGEQVVVVDDDATQRRLSQQL